MIKNFVKRSEKARKQLSLLDFVKNQLHRPRNIIAKLIRLPDHLDELIQDESERNRFCETLRSLIELHPHKISGLRLGFFTSPKVTHEHSRPHFFWFEKQGKPISSFFSLYAELSAQHDMKFGKPLNFDVLFFEPDTTGTCIVESWYQKEMHFRYFYAPAMGREAAARPAKRLELSVIFEGSTERGPQTDAFAQKTLDEMILAGSDPTKRFTFVPESIIPA